MISVIWESLFCEEGWTIEEGGQLTSKLAHCHYVLSVITIGGGALNTSWNLLLLQGQGHAATESLLRLTPTRASFENEITPSKVYGILSDILHLMSTFEFVSVSWIHRNRNKDADALAKQALFVVSFSVLNTGFLLVLMKVCVTRKKKNSKSNCLCSLLLSTLLSYLW